MQRLTAVVVLKAEAAPAIVEEVHPASVSARHRISDPVTVRVVNAIFVVVILRTVFPVLRIVAPILGCILEVF
jgi:hypothetical protein